MRVAEKSSRLREKNAMKNAYYEIDSLTIKEFATFLRSNLDIHLCETYNFQNQNFSINVISIGLKNKENHTC